MALLVVLALCLSVLAGSAGSAVQVGLADTDTDTEVTGVLHKDTGGGLNGDDDRWGDASPVNGDPSEPDPGDELTGGDGGHRLGRAQDEPPSFGGFALFVDIMFFMFFAR